MKDLIKHIKKAGEILDKGVVPNKGFAMVNGKMYKYIKMKNGKYKIKKQ